MTSKKFLPSTGKFFLINFRFQIFFTVYEIRKLAFQYGNDWTGFEDGEGDDFGCDQQECARDPVVFSVSHHVRICSKRKLHR